MVLRLDSDRFEGAHQTWFKDHLSRRTGERKGRLERGHQHGEKLFLRNIWWVLHSHFNYLHPEYEVQDWIGRPFYIDLAWLTGHAKIAFEIKGFGSHVRDMDRKRYCYELNRESFLQGMGFRIVSIPYDDVESRPELIISLLRMILGQYIIEPNPNGNGGSIRAERDILRLGFGLNRPIRPIDLVKELHMNYRTAIRHLESLCSKGRLSPIHSGKSTKVCQYQLVHDHSNKFVW